MVRVFFGSVKSLTDAGPCRKTSDAVYGENCSITIFRMALSSFFALL